MTFKTHLIDVNFLNRDDFMLEIDVIKSSIGPDIELPAYATSGSSGMDLRAHLMAPTHIHPGQIKLVDTGISIKIPLAGYEAQIRSRSGLSLNHGIIVLNSPGTIDSDYTGQIKVILMNVSERCYTINPGDRIAQLVFAEVVPVKFREVKSFAATERGDGGFGSTGVS